MNTGAAPRLAADFFDGVDGRARPVLAWVEAGRLHWAAEGAAASSVATGSAVWPERQRHGQRQLQLADGGVLVFADAAAFDAWAAAAGQGDRGVVRWQQSWRLVSLALLLFALCLVLLWRWAIPAVSAAAVFAVPQAVQQEIGARTLSYLDGQWLQPSRLDARAQAEVLRRFAAVAAAGDAAAQGPAYRIVFRDGGRLGANAFALPGGDIVVTDALLQMLHDEPGAVMGVLAHELGHVKHRHGLRQAAQAAALGVISGLVVGDFSLLLAGAPALLAQMDYSRDFEREADHHAREMLRAAGIDPRVMLVFFERLDKGADGRGRQALPIAFSSHPANAERIAFFSQR